MIRRDEKGPEFVKFHQLTKGPDMSNEHSGWVFRAAPRELQFFICGGLCGMALWRAVSAVYVDYAAATTIWCVASFLLFMGLSLARTKRG